MCAKCFDSKHTFRLARLSYTLLAYIKRQLNNLHPLPFLKIATTNAQVAIANLSPMVIYKKREKSSLKESGSQYNRTTVYSRI